MNLNLPFATFLVGIAALIAALVSSGINFLTAWLIRRSEERRQIRELAVRVAIEEWKWKSNVALISKKGGTIHPLDLYLVHAMYFVRLLGGKIKCEDQLRAHLRKSFSMTDAANQEIEDYSKKYHKENLTQQFTPPDV
jgi:hypothetical protein